MAWLVFISMLMFWCSIAAIAFTYVGFPFLILARGKWCRRPWSTSDHTPTVSVVIIAYNEAEAIERKIESVLSSDYPAELREIVVASDGSNDGTDKIVARFADRGVHLMSLPRKGKASAMNAAVAQASNDILIFSDANSIFATDSIRELVLPFNDETIGGVAGDQRYSKTVGNEPVSGAGEKSYWAMDRMLKQAESLSGNVISATGALYAIRRSLFCTVPEGVTDDFVTSTRVIEQGRRLVFAPDAVAFEPVASQGSLEYSRKVRVMTRGFRSVLTMRSLLNPFKHGFYSLQLFCHKVLRRLMFIPLALVLVSNLFLLQSSWIYQVALVAQLSVYLLALLGLLQSYLPFKGSKAFSIPFFFCMVNVAALVATYNLFFGRKIVVWETNRDEETNETKSQRITTS